MTTATADATPTATFGFDPAQATAHLCTADPALGMVIDTVGPFGMQLKSSRSLFGSLAEAIVYQQLSTKAAATIYGRLEALYPRATQGFTPLHILRSPDEKLRGVGLSRAKVLALRDLAQRVAQRQLPTLEEAQALADDALIERLIEVRGIGRWSAEMFLMFRLGRADVLPVDDYSLRKAYAAAFRKRKLPSGEALTKAGERWRPYRTVASWYLWQTLNAPATKDRK
jgi:DNA-3-methyladenine glycosylase II